MVLMPGQELTVGMAADAATLDKETAGTNTPSKPAKVKSTKVKPPKVKPAKDKMQPIQERLMRQGLICKK